jgi:mono/diheme cytochrome c family protein
MLTRGAVAALAGAAMIMVGCNEQQTVAVDNTRSGVDPPAPDGAMLAQERCAMCHDPGDGSYSGRMTPVVAMAYPANLTPDPDTGIGSWTDDDIRTAITTGVDDQGMDLCSVMPRFGDLSDAQLTSLIGFLRQLPAVASEVPPSMCD